MGARAVGIDVSSDAAWAVRADDLVITAARAFALDELDDLLAWCGADAVVAIDAPGALAEGDRHDHQRDRFQRARCSEFALASHGYYVREITPTTPDDCPPWMLTGFDIWRRLEPLRPREVYPDSIFRALSGRRAPLPDRKVTLTGRRLRRRLLDGAGMQLPPDADVWTHDAVDAAAACLVAATSTARRLECPQHPGTEPMWLVAGPVYGPAGPRSGTST